MSQALRKAARRWRLEVGLRETSLRQLGQYIVFVADGLAQTGHGDTIEGGRGGIIWGFWGVG